jgi:1-deoxy-D-xylulose-5-phosphate reductoisomerase
LKRLLVLGSTGSIGMQALLVSENLGGEFEIWGLSAHGNEELLLEQAKRWRPACVALTAPGAAESLRGRLPDGMRLFSGPEGLLEMCREAQGNADEAVAAIVGIAGLPAVAECIRAGLDIALANKEALVAGGGLVLRLLAEHGGKLYPVDSEHSAIFQCIQGLSSRDEIRRIILTASGGPFYGYTRDMLSSVTVEQALRHPNWSMGGKITIDSATLMNKGLEVVEARWLFGLPAESISVVIHRQSVVHSMVELADGSVLAQLGCPDMRIPIQYALTYPKRLPCTAPALDILKAGPLTFSKPDTDAFPCLGLAYEALRRGGGAAVAMNAANEVAVDKFIRGSIPFNDIPKMVEKGMNLSPSNMDAGNLEDIMALDAEIRGFLVGECGSRL